MENGKNRTKLSRVLISLVLAALGAAMILTIVLPDSPQKNLAIDTMFALSLLAVAVFVFVNLT